MATSVTAAGSRPARAAAAAMRPRTWASRAASSSAGARMRARLYAAALGLTGRSPRRYGRGMLTLPLLALLLVPTSAPPTAAHPPLLAAPPAPVTQERERERAWEAALGALRNTQLTAARVADDHLIVQDADGGLTALDPATGVTRWF